jgi:exopolyphosphatase/guanosine-5'-triphosphate,3'-diphosphate pyrophosphatase
MIGKTPKHSGLRNRMRRAPRKTRAAPVHTFRTKTQLSALKKTAMIAQMKPAKPGNAPPALKAVIDIGATAARMVIAEIAPGRPPRTLEYLEQGVSLGRDTFSGKLISNQTIEDCVRACRDFKTVLDEYSISGTESIRAVATSAVAEAVNRDLFLDRIFMATGLPVSVLDVVDINRLFYISILPLLQNKPELGQGELLAMEAGGGHTTALGLHNGAIRFAHTYRFGVFRTKETIEDAGSIDHIEGEIQSGIRPIFEELAGSKNVKLLILGSEARLTTSQIKPDKADGPVTTIRRSSFEHFVDTVIGLSPAELTRKFSLLIAGAETFIPALLTIRQVARQLQCKTLHIGSTTMRDGLLREMTGTGTWDDRFTKQIIQSATGIGQHYGFDPKHALNVTAHSKAIFHCTQPLHQLTERDEVILTVAALLHDIGSFISNRNHHKHSQYLIENSDIFGLNRHDLNLAALIARYHRRAHPKSTHRTYTNLTRRDRLLVNKLAAILRIADALDRGHLQRVSNPRLSLQPDRLLIGIPDVRNCSVEEAALQEKSKLFEQVYGKKAVLYKTRPGTPS